MTMSLLPHRNFTHLAFAVVSVLSMAAALGCGDLSANSELVSVTYGDGKFVAVGYHVSAAKAGEFPANNALIAVSNDGENWSTPTLDDEAAVYDVAYGNGQFVALGSRVEEQLDTAPIRELRILTSPDGTTWTRQSTEPRDSSFYDIAYGNGIFVATSPGASLVSTDGVSWQFAPDRALQGNVGLAFVDEEFVAWGSGGTILRSSDGVTWTEENADGVWDVWHLAWINEQWLGAGVEGISRPYEASPDGPLVLRSADLSNWTSSRPFSKQLPRDFAYGAGSYVSVFHEQAPMTSTDGVSWTSTDGDEAIGTDVVFADGKFVTVGPDGVFTSGDGKSWKQRLEMDEF